MRLGRWLLPLPLECDGKFLLAGVKRQEAAAQSCDQKGKCRSRSVCPECPCWKCAAGGVFGFWNTYTTRNLGKGTHNEIKLCFLSIIMGSPEAVLYAGFIVPVFKLSGVDCSTCTIIQTLKKFQILNFRFLNQKCSICMQIILP